MVASLTSLRRSWAFRNAATAATLVGVLWPRRFAGRWGLMGVLWKYFHTFRRALSPWVVQLSCRQRGTRTGAHSNFNIWLVDRQPSQAAMRCLATTGIEMSVPSSRRNNLVRRMKYAPLLNGNYIFKNGCKMYKDDIGILLAPSAVATSVRCEGEHTVM